LSWCEICFGGRTLFVSGDITTNHHWHSASVKSDGGRGTIRTDCLSKIVAEGYVCKCC
jgi:hypothetical protein